MAQQSREHTALAENPASVPSTHAVWLTTNACNSSIGHQDLSVLRDNLHKFMKVHTHTNMHKNKQINVKRKKKPLISLSCLSLMDGPPCFRVLFQTLIPTQFFYQLPESLRPSPRFCPAMFSSQHARITRFFSVVTGTLSLLSYSQKRAENSELLSTVPGPLSGKGAQMVKTVNRTPACNKNTLHSPLSVVTTKSR